MKSISFIRGCALFPLTLLLVACQGAAPASPTASTPRPTRPANSVSITIVTNGTKAEWLDSVTKTFNDSRSKTATGRQIVVQVVREDTPEATTQNAAAGELQSVLWSPSDVSWVDQANQLRKDNGQAPIASDPCPSIAYIPTGFAMGQTMAEVLGWPDKPISWKQIIELAADPQGWARYGHPEWGPFTFGHSHPVYSSTGFNLLASLAYAAAGKTANLTPEDVKSEGVKNAFRQVEKNTYYYGTSTTALVNPMEQRGPTYLHAAMASETSVLWPDVHNKTTTYPLLFIFPAEGTYWMDNPTCILDASWVTAEQREAARIYRDYLLSPASQDKAVEIGLRPVLPSTEIHCPICLTAGTDPRVDRETVPPLQPVSAATKAAILETFRETKKKATIFIVLDRSGSMLGDKLTNAIAATKNFISRLDPADKVQVNAFSYQVESLGPLGTASDVRAATLEALSGLKASGRTALNDAVCTTMQSVQVVRDQDRAAGEPRLYGIVLLTDGIDEGSEQQDPLACLPEDEEMDSIKVFTIAYGNNADAKLLKQMASLTNGRSSTGDAATIEQVYLAISAEQ